MPEIKADKFVDAVREACRNALIKAARKFILAAVPRVPVLTGFARGAFGNLEDVAGATRFKAVRAKRKYYYYPKRGPRVLKTRTSGRQFATSSENLFSKGRAVVAQGQSVIFFRFSIDITYFNLLDRNKWGAFKAGIAAFDEELKVQLKKLTPKIGKYLIKKDIKK